jgi:hypothetical protein
MGRQRFGRRLLLGFLLRHRATGCRQDQEREQNVKIRTSHRQIIPEVAPQP